MKTVDVAFGLYALVCLAAITWPGFALVRPHVSSLVLGVPFDLAWNAGWVGLTFAVLLGYHRLR